MMHYYAYYSTYPFGPFATLAAFVFYFLPSFMAAFRRHPNRLAIFLLNLLLGWTFIGWVVALVWSFTAIENSKG